MGLIVLCLTFVPALKGNCTGTGDLLLQLSYFWPWNKNNSLQDTLCNSNEGFELTFVRKSSFIYLGT